MRGLARLVGAGEVGGGWRGWPGWRALAGAGEDGGRWRGLVRLAEWWGKPEESRYLFGALMEFSPLARHNEPAGLCWP